MHIFPEVSSGVTYRMVVDSSSYEEQPVNIPHDELDPSKFPQHQLILKKDWSPSLAASTDENDAERQAKQLEEADGQEGSREFILKDFSLLKNQTLALKVINFITNPCLYDLFKI